MALSSALRATSAFPKYQRRQSAHTGGVPLPIEEDLHIEPETTIHDDAPTRPALQDPLENLRGRLDPTLDSTSELGGNPE